MTYDMNEGLVERLRNGGWSSDLKMEAANRIEELEAAMDRDANTSAYRIKELEARVADLRAEIEQLKGA